MSMYATEDVMPVYTNPGEDTTQYTTQQLVDLLLAKVGRDGMLDQEEMRAIQSLQAGLQMIAQRALAGQGMQPQGPPQDQGTEDFGEGAGAPVEEGMPGTQPFGGG